MGAKLCGDFGYFSEMEILWNILTKKWYGFISLFKVHFGGGDENSVRKQRKDGKKNTNSEAIPVIYVQRRVIWTW